MVTVAKPLQREIHRDLDFLIDVNFFEVVDGSTKWYVFHLCWLL